MHLMVYAPYGRTGIYMLQEFCRRVGIAGHGRAGSAISSPRSGRCRPDTRWRRCCARRPTSASRPALADALLHPQDRAYSVPQLFDLLARGGLTVRPLAEAGALRPALRRHGAPSHRPRASRSCRRGSSTPPSSCSAARWSATAWSSYRDDDEARLAASRLRRRRLARLRAASGAGHDLRFAERLPPGAAAVLINRGHTYRDLYLPIDAREKRPSRPSTASARRARSRRPPGMGEEAAGVFERLYRHDQVLFDTSAASRSTPRRRDQGAAARRRTAPRY